MEKARSLESELLRGVAEQRAERETLERCLERAVEDLRQHDQQLEQQRQAREHEQQLESEQQLQQVLVLEWQQQQEQQQREERVRGYSRALFERLLRRAKKPQKQLEAYPSADSPVLAKLAFCVPVTEMFKWQNFQKLIDREHPFSNLKILARACAHPDSLWFSSVCEDVTTRQEARELFLSIENDARALCFAWCLSDDRNDHSLLRRSAEMGFGFACSLMCEKNLYKDNNEWFAFAQVAAGQHAHNAHYKLALKFRLGLGCEQDLLAAKENFMVAAAFGCRVSAANCAMLLDESEPARWSWWGIGLELSSSSFDYALLSSFSRQVALFFSGSGSSSVVFEIGRALKGKIDTEQSKILEREVFDLIGPANQAVSFYDFQIKSTRRAVNTWTLISRHLKIIKDVRIVIGKMIWETRFEASFRLDLGSASPVQKRARK